LLFLIQLIIPKSDNDMVEPTNLAILLLKMVLFNRGSQQQFELPKIMVDLSLGLKLSNITDL
jgi:hypothetical protein